MTRSRLRVFTFICVFSVCVLAIAQEEFEAQITRHDWPMGATAKTVLSIPQLKTAIFRHFNAEDSILIIRYPGGDIGNEWAIEVRNMFVSLGIESKFIEIEPGSGIEDTLLVVVFKKRSRL